MKTKPSWLKRNQRDISLTKLDKMPLTAWGSLARALVVAANVDMTHLAYIIEARALKLLRLAAYLNARGQSADNTHEDAVKYQNEQIAKVRKALGYDPVKEVITFGDGE